MPNLNRFDLPRYIPEEVKRQVRSECGFGCVLCGLALYDYDHFDPPFEDARAHNAAGIALLCIHHHGLKTRGMIATETVAAARKHPRTFKTGEAREAFELRPPFSLSLGKTVIRDVSSIIEVDGETWFSVLPPESPEGPMRLSVTFYGHDGSHLLSICDNEWIVQPQQWDVKTVGRNIVVRTGPKQIGLDLTSTPPHGLTLNQLHMTRGDVRIEIDAQGWVVIERDGAITESYADAFRHGACVFRL